MAEKPRGVMKMKGEEDGDEGGGMKWKGQCDKRGKAVNDGDTLGPSGKVGRPNSTVPRATQNRNSRSTVIDEQETK